MLLIFPVLRRDTYHTRCCGGAFIDTMNHPALCLLVAPVAVWTTGATIDAIADSELLRKYAPDVTYAARVLLLQVDKTLPLFSDEPTLSRTPLVGCLLCFCRHRSYLQTLDTISRFISVCWRDLQAPPKDIVVDYVVGVVGGVSACVSVIPLLSTRSVAAFRGAGGTGPLHVPLIADALHSVSRWWSGAPRGHVSATWIGGSPFVLALSGFRVAFRGDLQAIASVLPAVFRRLVSLYESVVKPATEAVDPRAIEQRLERACHDWVEISAFSVGLGVGAAGCVGRLALTGFRLRHQQQMPFLGRFASHPVLPEHPVQHSAALVRAFEEGTAPKEFVCPLTHALFEQPVVAADGHTYEASFMQEWLTQRDTSPTCGTQLPHLQLVANYTLRSLMETWTPPSSA